MIFISGLKIAENAVRTYTHFPRLFLDHRRAIAAGYLYGLPKKWARFETSHANYSIYSGKRPLIEAEFHEVGVFGKPNLHPGCAPLLNAMKEPVFQQTFLGHNIQFKVSWAADFEVRNSHAKFIIREEFLPSLPLGTFETSKAWEMRADSKKVQTLKGHDGIIGNWNDMTRLGTSFGSVLNPQTCFLEIQIRKVK